MYEALGQLASRSKSAAFVESAHRTRVKLRDTAELLHDDDGETLVDHIGSYMPSAGPGASADAEREWICYLQRMRNLVGAGVDLTASALATSGLMQDQQGVLDLLVSKAWRGPCSVYVLLRINHQEEPSLVILFGEHHSGYVDKGPSGIEEFFKQVSNFPVEIFVEEDVRKKSSPIEGEEEEESPLRLVSITNQLRQIRKSDKARGLKNRMNFVDVRDLHHNADEILHAEERRPAALARLCASWASKVEGEIARIEQTEAAGILKRAVNAVVMATCRCTTSGAASGYSCANHRDAVQAMSRWLDVYAVSRLIRKLERHHTAIVYAGSAHVKGMRPEHRVCHDGLPYSAVLSQYEILPLLQRLGFELIASHEGCYTTA
jgi:hypothetical protein